MKNGKGIFIREPSIVPSANEVYQKNHTTEELYLAFMNVLEKNNRKLPPPVKSFDGIVNTKQISVSHKLLFILRNLVRVKIVRFYDLFLNIKSRSEVVATFLAVLELTKSKKINVDTEAGGEIIMKVTDDGE
ncbi:Segregation and condensation protein A [bioreactor metagenome]|uniref:Segregation and condensation protein A n=1 Tax=bioreactor metagenome TaxID=1076179 RepID=A0A645AYR9_9ZZZZ